MIRKKEYSIYDNSGSIASYIMVLFGMIIMLWMFGFKSMWTLYTTNSSIGNESTISLIANGTTGFFGMILAYFTSSLSGMITGGIFAIFGVGVAYFTFKNNSAIWQYVIPIILLGVLNIFVFPVSMITSQFEFGDLTDFLSVALLLFFNLFYILAVIEFIRGGATS